MTSASTSKRSNTAIAIPFTRRWYVNRLRHNDVGTRIKAVNKLGECGDLSVVEHLIYALNEQKSITECTVLVKALGKLEDKTARQVVFSQLTLESYFSAEDYYISGNNEMAEEVIAATVKTLLKLGENEERIVERLILMSLHRLVRIKYHPPSDGGGEYPVDDYRCMSEAAQQCLEELRPSDEQLFSGYLLVLLDTGLNGDTRSEAASKLGDFGDVRAVRPLIECLSNKDLRIRATAADSLGKFEDLNAVNPLIECLIDENDIVRSSAAFALGKLGDIRAIGGLIECLSDEEEHIRGRAATSLGKLGDVSVVEPLIELASGQGVSENIRFTTVNALGELGGLQANSFLKEKLSDEEPRIRMSAAVGLGKFKDKRAVDFLIKVLSDNEEEQFVRDAAANALGQIGGPKCCEPLIERLTDKNKNVRKNIVDVLVQLEESSTIELVIKKLPNKEYWQARNEIEQVLDGLGATEEQKIEGFLVALASDSLDIRRNAEEILEELGATEEQLVDGYIEALSSEELGTFENATEALGKLGNHKASEPLANLLTKDKYARQYAAYALANLGDERAVEPLIELLSDGQSNVRRNAAILLGKLKDTRALEPLIKALTEQHFDVRVAAALSLGELGDQRAIAPLTERLAFRDGRVDRAAAIALASLGDSKAFQSMIKELPEQQK